MNRLLESKNRGNKGFINCGIPISILANSSNNIYEQFYFDLLQDINSKVQKIASRNKNSTGNVRINIVVTFDGENDRQTIEKSNCES